MRRQTVLRTLREERRGQNRQAEASPGVRHERRQDGVPEACGRAPSGNRAFARPDRSTAATGSCALRRPRARPLPQTREQSPACGRSPPGPARRAGPRAGSDSTDAGRSLRRSPARSSARDRRRRHAIPQRAARPPLAHARGRSGAPRPAAFHSRRIQSA